MSASSPPGTPTTKRVPGWVSLVSLLALGIACYAGLSLPGLALAAVGRVGPVSEVPASVGRPEFPPSSRGSVDRDDPQTTARFADGTQIVLGPVRAVPFPPGAPIRLSVSDWTGYPVGVASGTQRAGLLPMHFGPPSITIPAQVAAFALLVLVWRRNGPGYGMLLVFALAITCMMGQFEVSRDATPHVSRPVAATDVPARTVQQVRWSAGRHESQTAVRNAGNTGRSGAASG